MENLLWYRSVVSDFGRNFDMESDNCIFEGKGLKYIMFVADTIHFWHVFTAAILGDEMAWVPGNVTDYVRIRLRSIPDTEGSWNA